MLTAPPRSACSRSFKTSILLFTGAGLLTIGQNLVAQSPITGIGNTTTTPIPGVPHDYLGGLNETVNPANGALSIRLKAPTPHERGVNWPYYLFTYDSNLQYKLMPSWQLDQTGSGTVAELQQLPYWLAIVAPLGQVNIASITLPSGNGTSQEYGCQMLSGALFLDPDGGLHNLGLGVAVPNTNYGQAEGSCTPFPSAFNQYTGGDERYKAYVTNPNSNPVQIAVVDTHGDIPSVEDSNGNYFNTTNRTWTTTQNSNGYTLTIPGVSGSYTFTETTGSAPSFTLNITPVSSATGCNDITSSSFGPPAGTPGESVENVLTITLPDNESYQFTYDPVFNLINKITYPTGAWVEYTWSVVPDADGQQQTDQGNSEGSGCPFVHDWFAITKRVVSDYTAAASSIVPVEEQDFCYTTTWPGSGTYGNCAGQGSGSPTSFDWTSKTTTVTTKDLIRGTSFQTVYTYSPVQPPPEAPSGSPETLGVVPQENTISYYDTNGSLLKAVTKTWQNMNLMSGECITQPNVGTSGKFYQYLPYTAFGSNFNTALNPDAVWTDLPIDVAEYDYGQITNVCTQPGAGVKPIRETKTCYVGESSCTSQTFNTQPLFPYAYILDRPASVQVYGYGNLLSETDYTYDQLTPTYFSMYGHDDTNYGSGSAASRGNLTTITKDCFVSGCTASTTTYTYDTGGNVLTATDPCGNATCSDMSGSNHTTSYTYTDNYTTDDGTGPGDTYAYVTKITDALSHTTEFQWGFEDGKLRLRTDENGQPTRFCYVTTSGCNGGNGFDPFFRLTGVAYPDGGNELATYVDAGPTPTVTASVLQGGTWLTTTTTYDALGRPITVVDPASATVNTTYDGLGHVKTVTNSFFSNSDPTYGVTTYNYDALGRKTIQVQQDGSSTLQWCYNDIATQGQTNCQPNLGTETGPTALQHYSWTDYSDETGRHWQQITDGLGRLSAVVEPTPTLSGGSPLETDYQYDALGNLLQVDQWGGPYGSSGDRQRVFNYDNLSRLIMATNPETGTSSYIYDADSNLSSKTTPAPNSPAGSTATVTSSYMYDVLNRPLSKSSNDTAATPTACYQYDQSSQGNSNANLIGRLANEWTQSSNTACPTTLPASGALTSKLLSYDSMGRVKNEETCIYPYQNCATVPPQFSMMYDYDFTGKITLYTNGVATSGNDSISLTNGYDNAGRLLNITSSWEDATHPSPLFSNPTYNAPGDLTAATYGSNGPTLSRTYDNRLRITGESDSGSTVQAATPGSATVTITGEEQTQ
jgi:YD repeat-containing protein